MRRILSTTVFVVALLLCNFPIVTIQAQELAPQHKFVQLHVENLKTLVESRSIDSTIRSKQGVLASRTDHRSKILFCVFDLNSSITEASFNNWLHNMGFGIDCYREGVHGVDKILAREEFVCK